MAFAASVEITVTGEGSHAVAPDQGIDPIMIGTEIVTAPKTISSLITNRIEGIFVSITQFHAGDAMNVRLEYMILKGTAQSFAYDAPTAIGLLIRRIAENKPAAHGGVASLEYSHLYPV